MYDSRPNRHSGFTLIEALIAFVVLTVGILGTLLFHSALLKDSGDNKARLEAIKVAEDWIEKRRSSVATASAYLSNIASLAAGSASVPGTNTTYTISWASASLASGASSDVYKIDLTISWPETSEPVQLSSYFGYLDPDNTIRPEDAADGAGSTGYSGNIPIPTGTLKEIPRIQVVDLDEIDNATASRAQDSLVVYQNASVARVAVQIDDDVYVQLAELQNFDNEILTITGRIYLSQASGHDVDELFGPVYGVSSAVTSVDTDDELSPFYRFDEDDIQVLDDGLSWLENIIDIRASAGASCVISRYGNTDGNEGDGDLNPWTRGLYGDYICVAGTGWNGSIKPYKRQYYFDDTRGAFGSRDIEIDGLVCGPALRSYRYFTLGVSDLESFDNYLTSVSERSLTIQEALTAASAAVVGQSGLVRFYQDDETLQASPSGEGVLWQNFFWHNPYYIVSPTQEAGDFDITASLAAPSPATSSSIAQYGYATPKINAVSNATSAYQVQFPGDVAHQNFYVADPGSGGGAWDCDDVWRSFRVGGDDQVAIVSYPDQTAFQGVSSAYDEHGHLVEFGLPGYTGVSAYIPSTSTSSFEESDYNNYNASLSTGAIILGYTLATESIEGTITFDNTLASLADFSLGGNPEPVISVQCVPDTGSEVTSGSRSTFEFSCAVPANWVGYVFAFNRERTVDSNNPVPVVNPILPIENSASAARDISDLSDNGNTAVTYYYNLPVASGGLGSSSTVSAADFSWLTTKYIDTGSGSTIDSVIFEFTD